MIKQLKKRLIRVCGAVLVTVLAAILLTIWIVIHHQLNEAMDSVTNRIAMRVTHEKTIEDRTTFKRMEPQDRMSFKSIFLENGPKQIQYFIALYDKDDQLQYVDVSSISEMAVEEASELVNAVYGKEYGWYRGFRYGMVPQPEGKIYIFTDGEMNLALVRMIFLTVSGILILCFLLIFFLIVLFSARAVRPIAESEQKQKQFITDAGHELKTPLTLMMTNLEILEMEYGENEWISDTKEEGQRMTSLINQMVFLARMDEKQSSMEQLEKINVSKVLKDIVEEFDSYIQQSGKRIDTSIADGLICSGSEEEIRRLFCIFLDNAVKYTENGIISVRAYKKNQNLEIRFENPCSSVMQMDLSRLFDRFYRADSSRTEGGSFGIGLSIAKKIAEHHGGTICAYAKDDNTIGFRIVLSRKRLF